MKKNITRDDLDDIDEEIQPILHILNKIKYTKYRPCTVLMALSQYFSHICMQQGMTREEGLQWIDTAFRQREDQSCQK